MRSIFAGCAMLGLALLTACGGGGGGGSVNPGATAGAYIGNTSQATITQANAVALSADAYTIGATGASLNIAAVAGQPAEAVSSSSALTQVAAVVKASAATALKAQLAASSSLAGYVASSSVVGAYGGSASFTININESSNYFLGTMIFTNYRDTAGGPVISGTVTVSGSYNPVSGAFNSLTMTLSPLSATYAGNSIKIYGTITFTVNNSSEVMQISCTVDVNGTVHWISDWTYTYFTDGTVTLSGRYYHPAYGYVTISTLTPIVISSTTGEPIWGSLLFTGANGTKAKVIFTVGANSVSADASGTGQWVQVR